MFHEAAVIHLRPISSRYRRQPQRYHSIFSTAAVLRVYLVERSIISLPEIIQGIVLTQQINKRLCVVAFIGIHI
jgi:hypothetical protein